MLSACRQALCVLGVIFCAVQSVKLRHSPEDKRNQGVQEIPVQPGFSDLLHPDQLLAPASTASKKPKNAAKMNLMEQSVLMLAEANSAPVADDSANLTEFVVTINEALDNMTRDLWDSASVANQACYTAYNNLTGCTSYSADTTFGPPDFDGNFDPLRSAHATCRSELAQLEYRHQRCETAASSSFTLEEAAVAHFQSLNIFESPTECATSDTDVESYIDAMIQHFTSKETAWWLAYDQMQNLSSNSSSWNCEEITLEYYNKSAECAGLQLAFENTACDVWDRTNSSCSNLTNCYEEQWVAYQNAVNSSNATLEDLGLEYRAIQRMYCLVNAFAASDVNAAIDVCINTVYSSAMVTSNSTCVNTYAASQRPTPVTPDICNAVVCASHITISGAESYQSDMMGTYQRTELPTTSYNAFRPIYENHNGKHLYYIAAHNVWMISHNGDTQTTVGGVYGYGGDTTCPETVLYWITYTNAGWRWISSMTFSVSTEDPSWRLFTGIAVRYPGRHMFQEVEYTDNNINAGPCLASCCSVDPYTWILHQNVSGTQFYVPSNDDGEYPTVWQAKQACEASTELNCLGVYEVSCSGASPNNPARLITAGTPLSDSSIGSCVEEMYLGNTTTATTTLPEQLCTYRVNISTSATDYNAVWKSLTITRQDFDEQFVFTTCTTEGTQAAACIGQGVQNGVRVLSNRHSVGVDFGSCCFNVTNQVLSTETESCNGYFNDYNVTNGRFVLETRLSGSYGTMVDARNRCLRLGPLCWGIMDDGCDGSNFRIIDAREMTSDSDLLASSQGTCVYQKRIDPNFDSFPTDTR